MKNNVFPFFTDDLSSAYSMVHLTLLEVMALFWEKRKDGVDISQPETDIYNSFVKNLENYLCSDFCLRMTHIVNIISEGINKKFNQDGIDLIAVFIQTRDEIVNNKKPDINNVKILSASLCGDTEDSSDNCACLLRWFDFDFDVIRSYFLKIDKLPDETDIKECFCKIATKGMRTFITAMIKAHDNKFNHGTVKLIRTFSERFCLYIKLLANPVDTTTPFKHYYSILSLMEAAYDDGKICREIEIYDKQSLEVMASLGTSFTMKEKSKPKNDLKASVEDFVRSKYDSQSQLKTKDMKELVLSKSEFIGLKPYAIEAIIRKVKKEKELDERKK